MDIKSIYELLHKNPELGNQEYVTANIIESFLNSLHIPYVKMLETGIVGFIDKGKSKTIILRAEMDAIKINGKVIHACGHDMHVAMLLGVAEKLLCADIECNVKLVFQPDEEGYGGAERMIDKGVLDSVSSCFAMHVWPEFEFGEVGLKVGELTSTCDFFEIEVLGKGGHVAKPDYYVNPISIAFDIAKRLEKIKLNEPFLLDITSINADEQEGTANAVPNICKLRGSMRVVNAEKRYELSEKIENNCRNYNCKYTPTFLTQYPPMINDERLINLVQKAISKYVKIIKIDKPYFIAEDFACFSEKIPSTLILLGCTPKEKLGNNELHTQDLIIDERTLQLGIDLWEKIVRDYK